MAAKNAPPRWAVSLLDRLLRPTGQADEIVGDLIEELGSRRLRRRRGAQLWFVGEAMRLSLRLAPRALADALAARLARPRRPAPQENPMSQLVYDLRLALRALGRRPSTTAVMVVTLALGLAANAAIFGVLDALLLHPFDFERVERLVDVKGTSQMEEFGVQNLSPAAFLDLRGESGDLVEALVGFEEWGTSLRGEEAAFQLQGSRVSPEFFETLRVRPLLGRSFLTAGQSASGPPELVVGYDLWQQRFGGDRGVLGQTVDLDGEAFTLVGVAPKGFAFPEGSEVWAPLTLSPEEAIRRDRRDLGAFGRLRDGVSPQAAKERFALIGRRFEQQFPETDRGRGLEALSFSEAFRDAGLGPILGLWQGAALFVLLIGWVNLANLMLARGAERQHELALLDALGAGRLRLVRLQLTEGLLVGTAAALLSLPATWLALRLIRGGMPVEIQRYVAGWKELGINLPATGFTFGLALISVAAVSVWPALQASGWRLANALREGGGRSGAIAARGSRGRGALVVGEIAAALVLVVVGAVSVRGARSMIDGPQGFDRHHLLTLKMDLPADRYRDAAARRAFVRDAIAKLKELPGVEEAAIANVLPAGNNSSRPIAIEGEPEPDPAQPPLADARTVSPGYFSTLRLPLAEGRGFSAADDENALPVAIVSRSMAARDWPGRDPIGARFRAGGADAPWLTVIGVAGDHVHHWFSRRNFPTYFQPYAQQPGSGLAVALRTRGEPDSLERQVRSALAGLDPYLPLYDMKSMDDAIRVRAIGLRYISSILSVMALLALVLALSGVYAVMSYSVSLRVREIGVRVALGASARDVLGATLGRTLRLAAVGLAIGLAGSLAVSRWLAAVLRGVAGVDPGLLALGTLLLGLTALVAGIVPARRALRFDPARVLRGE